MKNVYVFSSRSEISELEFSALRCHLWRKEYPAFYESKVALCAVSGRGLYVCFKAEEPSPRAVFTERDAPVYNDSCMEFFLQPFADDDRYINFEINPNGAYLSAIGYDRASRIFLREISECEPKVSARISDSGWSAELFVPEKLISDAFGRKFSVDKTEYIRANFYKCGDLTLSPHYSSLFSVDTPIPDYHRPEFFSRIFFKNK